MGYNPGQVPPPGGKGPTGIWGTLARLPLWVKVGAPIVVVLLLIAAFWGGSAIGRSESTASVEATTSPEPTISSPSPSPSTTEEPTKTPTPITPAPKTPTPKAEVTATPAPAAPPPTPTPAPTPAPTPQPTPTPTTEPTPTPTTEPSPTPTAEPTPSETPSPGEPKTTFADGTHLVNVDIAPGTYVAPGGKSCFWERESGTPDEPHDIIANETPNAQTIVTIEPTDKTFVTQGCGTWKPQPTSGKPKKAFGPGTFEVGIDIVAGTYKAPGGAECEWARLSGFGGTVGDVNEGRHPEGPAVVTIEPGDKGFFSRGCGHWKKQ